MKIKTQIRFSIVMLECTVQVILDILFAKKRRKAEE
jgi:hypothetical protein